MGNRHRSKKKKNSVPPSVPQITNVSKDDNDILDISNVNTINTITVKKKTKSVFTPIKLICSHLIRISLNTQEYITFPHDIINLIHKLSSTDGDIKALNGKYKSATDDYRHFDLTFNSLTSTFSMLIDQDDTSLTGNFDYEYLLNFDTKCLLKVINGFNHILDHRKRQQIYIKRTIQLYKKHNIFKKKDDIHDLYNNNGITRRDSRHYFVAEPVYDECIYDYDCSNDDDDVAIAAFVDYHDIYCVECAKLNETPQNVYIGGKFIITKKSRYCLAFYFNDRLICNMNNNIFNIFRYQWKETNQYRHPASLRRIEVTFQLDIDINYFELYYFNQVYSKNVFKAKGKIINNQLIFEDKYKFKSQQFVSSRKTNKTKVDYYDDYGDDYYEYDGDYDDYATIVMSDDDIITFKKSNNSLQILNDNIVLWEMKRRTDLDYHYFDFQGTQN